jgi:hypothetical protein
VKLRVDYLVLWLDWTRGYPRTAADRLLTLRSGQFVTC